VGQKRGGRGKTETGAFPAQRKGQQRGPIVKGKVFLQGGTNPVRITKNSQTRGGNTQFGLQRQRRQKERGGKVLLITRTRKKKRRFRLD